MMTGNNKYYNDQIKETINNVLTEYQTEYMASYKYEAFCESILFVFMFVYACMYVCMRVCMHVCVTVRMYVCIYVCMYVCMHVCVAWVRISCLQTYRDTWTYHRHIHRDIENNSLGIGLTEDTGHRLNLYLDRLANASIVQLSHCNVGDI